MRKYYSTILFFLLFIISACGDSYESPNEVDPKDLNKEISKGVKANAEWVKTPQTIVKQLLPREAHQEGNYSYGIEERRLSESRRNIIVNEEGAFDDEVSGQKTCMTFELIKETWQIINMSVSLKRRR